MMDKVDCKKLKYSDDGNAFRTGPINDIQMIADKISKDLQHMVNWCHQWRMPLNLSKTKFMVCSKTPVNDDISVVCNIKKVDGTSQTLSIDRTKEERILGVYYDEQMTFKAHLDYLVNSSLSNINKIRQFIFSERGLPTKFGIILYSAYVRAKIESSYPAWSIINETDLQRLDTIQGLANDLEMKMILNIKGSTLYNFY